VRGKSSLLVLSLCRPGDGRRHMEGFGGRNGSPEARREGRYADLLGCRIPTRMGP
jgi:hypothetical protein